MEWVRVGLLDTALELLRMGVVVYIAVKFAIKN
jgi:hypothetical protein